MDFVRSHGDGSCSAFKRPGSPGYQAGKHHDSARRPDVFDRFRNRALEATTGEFTGQRRGGNSGLYEPGTNAK